MPLVSRLQGPAYPTIRQCQPSLFPSLIWAPTAVLLFWSMLWQRHQHAVTTPPHPHRRPVQNNRHAQINITNLETTQTTEYQSYPSVNPFAATQYVQAGPIGKAWGQHQLQQTEGNVPLETWIKQWLHFISLYFSKLSTWSLLHIQYKWKAETSVWIFLFFIFLSQVKIKSTCICHMFCKQL